MLQSVFLSCIIAIAKVKGDVCNGNSCKEIRKLYDRSQGDL